MKVAVPVSGKNNTVFIRTGRAPLFAIYSIDGNQFRFVRHEKNPNAGKHHHHGGPKPEHTDEHHINSHVHHLRVIEDCDALLAVAVGPNMKKALNRLNIEHVKFKKKDGERAEDLVRNFIDMREMDSQNE